MPLFRGRTGLGARLDWPWTEPVVYTVGDDTPAGTGHAIHLGGEGPTRTAGRPDAGAGGRHLRPGLPLRRPGRGALRGPCGRIREDPLGGSLLLSGVLRRGDGGGTALPGRVSERHRG